MSENWQDLELWQGKNRVDVEIYDAEDLTVEDEDRLAEFFDREFEKIPLEDQRFRIIIHQLNNKIKDCTLFTELNGKIILLKGPSYAGSLQTVYGMLAGSMAYIHNLLGTDFTVDLTDEEADIISGINKLEIVSGDQIISEMDDVKIGDQIIQEMKEEEDQGEEGSSG